MDHPLAGVTAKALLYRYLTLITVGTY